MGRASAAQDRPSSSDPSLLGSCGGSFVVRNARAAKSRLTQVRIAEASATLFTERGYGGTTLQAIADRAGVSVETVGLAGPKRKLLQAAFEMSFAGSSTVFPAAGEPAYLALAREHDFDTVVAEYVRLLTAAIARTAGLWRAFQAAADADPRAAEAFKKIQAVRRHEFTQSARWLVQASTLEEDQVSTLVKEFFLHASHETYLLLETECSFAPQDFATHVHTQIVRLLSEFARPTS